jgi:hypothetical protein
VVAFDIRVFLSDLGEGARPDVLLADGIRLVTVCNPSAIWKFDFYTFGVPTFRMLVWGVEYEELRAFVLRSWFSQFLSAADVPSEVTRIERKEYFYQYAAEGLFRKYEMYRGKWWGIFGKHALPGNSGWRATEWNLERKANYHGKKNSGSI